MGKSLAATNAVNFDAVFERSTSTIPYPYQRRLATEGPTVPALLDVPTGLGKTAAAVLAWVWRRRFASESICKLTPRRLVYCLPMRVLVEQTYAEAACWLARLGLLAGKAEWDAYEGDNYPKPKARLVCEGYKADPHDSEPPTWSADNGDQGSRRIAVHLLMGGEERTDWALWPECDAILIGTQDMLLSRALNRGYAAKRPRWPIEFGLLHSDCLWVLDEVQVMGNGLATSAQLSAFAEKLWKPARPAQFLWMSATLGKTALQTRDRKEWGLIEPAKQELSSKDLADKRVQKRRQAEKTIRLIPSRPKAASVLESHAPGRISLLILNTVPAAKEFYEEIQREIAKPVGKKSSKGLKPEVCLLHSRFRPKDRALQMQRLLGFTERADNTGIVQNSDGFVVVSSQVIESGFDISGARLWTEVSPWPSAIQRLGRLNREGAQPDALASFWMPKASELNKGDKSPNAQRIGPYDKKAIEVGKKLLNAVIAKQSKGADYRDALDAILATKDSQEALQFEPDVVIRPDDFFELFSTEPDLAGGFTNVSHFVRDCDRDVDVQVFWRDFDSTKGKQPDEPPPSREELCAVPFFEFRQFIGNGAAWEWDVEAGRWERRRPSDIWPGMTLLLPKAAGGYHKDLGWTGDPKNRHFGVLVGSGDNDSLDADFLSGTNDWVSVSDHITDVANQMTEILEEVESLSTPLGEALVMAARWHDWGKSVVNWQDAVKDHVTKASSKLEAWAAKAMLPEFAAVAAEWRDRLSLNGGDDLWAKFPDSRGAALDKRLKLSESERAQLARDLKVPFRPRLRHEAASALAAWQSWNARSDGLTALAVYLIACHHGKVRTVLRRTARSKDVFGLNADMILQPVPGFFPQQMRIQTDAKYVGAFGTWDDATMSFTISSPSWLQMIAELIGPRNDGEAVTSEVIPSHEPRELGPLVLAYLEALLRAADVRASRCPGRGRT